MTEPSKGVVPAAHGHHLDDFQCAACQGRLNLAISRTTVCPPTHGSILVCGWCGALLDCKLQTSVLTQEAIDKLEPKERDGLQAASQRVQDVIARRKAEKPS